MIDSKPLLAKMYKDAEYYLDKASTYEDVDTATAKMYNTKYEETMKSIEELERADRQLERITHGVPNYITRRTSYGELVGYPRG